jgi:hypothetical protein
MSLKGKQSKQGGNKYMGVKKGNNFNKVGTNYITKGTNYIPKRTRILKDTKNKIVGTKTMI